MPSQGTDSRGVRPPDGGSFGAGPVGFAWEAAGFELLSWLFQRRPCWSGWGWRAPGSAPGVGLQITSYPGTSVSRAPWQGLPSSFQPSHENSTIRRGGCPRDTGLEESPPGKPRPRTAQRVSQSCPASASRSASWPSPHPRVAPKVTGAVFRGAFPDPSPDLSIFIPPLCWQRHTDALTLELKRAPFSPGKV